MVMESILIIVTLSHIVQNVQIRRSLIVVYVGNASEYGQEMPQPSLHFLHHGIEPAHEILLYNACA